jgi:hypothetical protein
VSMASYPGDLDRVTRPMTKPVSGEAIVSSLDRMDAIAGHGTKAGYEAGCRGSHCPGKEAVGMSCSQASIRYAGDMSYRRRVDAGLSAEAIWAEDQAAGVVMPRLSTRDTRALNTWADGETTVADSVEDFDDEEETEPAPGIDTVAAPSRSAPLAGSVPSEPVSASGGRPAKWAVRRVWVAVAPDGVMHGPFAGQPEAVAFVGTKLPKPVPPVREKGTRRAITDAERVEIRRLHGEGLSSTKIAKQIGRPLSTVARLLALMGLKSNGHVFGEKWS